MKISVIGGGPGGLYFALLTKKARPDFDITVYEQNRPDDTFGFGVVFSDATLDEFLSADPDSYELIRDKFAYWDDIVVSYQGERMICGGNGFAGCSRLTLLQILQQRCEEVGVAINYETFIDVANLKEQFADSDIIIAADGINSAIREYYAEGFGRTIEYRPNKFTWMGSTKPLDAFTFFFKETEHGIIVAHTYQYEQGRSTWVIECQGDTWDKCGFADMSEEESARYLETVFTEELDGHPLIVNRSIWRNFPRVECKNWNVDNIVILGDAKASAHWSIGSGTKLAMECAIALSDSVLANPGNAQAAFKQYDEVRRTPVDIIQHNADVSLRWFEHMDRYWGKDKMQFAMMVMSRAKSITWDELRVRDEGFLRHVEDEFYERLARTTDVDCREARPTPMFTPLRLRDLTIENRVVMSPMAQYCAKDGMPDDWHFVHYSSRAVGGVGLMFTEMTCPSPDARITDACTGLWNDEQEAAWTRIVDFVHAQSKTKFCLQLGHAGRKGSTKTPAAGMDMPMAEGNWPIYSASPIPYIDGTSDTPIELNRAKMDQVKADFVAATKRGIRAGFDMLELHAAHGYLLASFLSPLTNQRQDEYGGSIDNRLKFPIEVFAAMRDVWPEDRPMSVRISASDWAEGGLSEEDLLAIARAFKEAGADLIDCSSGETVKWQDPVFGRMWQTPFADAIRNVVDIKTMAVGAITLPEQVNTIIATGRADLCALARPHLNNPYFTRHAAGHYGVHVDGWPAQYHSGVYQLMTEAEKVNEKNWDTALKLRPNRHGYTKASA